MSNHASFAEIAALAGDPGRSEMLRALMDGRALTASELAHIAGITPQTASSHLARMTTAGLISVAKQGRHRYHRLASEIVAQMIESIMQVASARVRAGDRLSSARETPRCGWRGPATTTSPAGSAWPSPMRWSAPDTSNWKATEGWLPRAGWRFCPRRHRCRCAPAAIRQAYAAPPVSAMPGLERKAASHRRQDRGGDVRRTGCPRAGSADIATRAIAITPTGEQIFREQFGLDVPKMRN